MPVTRAVLFDLHGTLAFIDRKVEPASVSKLLISRGKSIYPQTWAAAVQFVSMVDYPRHGFGSFKELVVRTMRILGEVCDDETADELAAEYEKERWKSFPDAEEALRKLKAMGMQTAIITTIPRWRFERYIGHLLPLVDMVVDGRTFGVEKSDPRIYTGTLATLGVEAGEAVMVGDEELTDVIVPQSIGMHAMLLRRSGGENGSVHKGKTIMSLKEIPDMLP